jgi:hypothetical protein
LVFGPWSIVLLLTLPALWPLLSAGFYVSDDGLFHVYRIAALADAWGHGVLYPRLFPDFGFGYGQAVLNFYAPLTYFPGALLASFGLSPVTATEVVVALGFVLAALAAYGFVRSLWGPTAGVLAAVSYTYFPYHLADAYLRGAIPEHFAFAWLPLILWATTDAFRKERAGAALLWGALAWAGLVFTHNLTALLMAPAWAVYVLVMSLWTRRWRRLIGLTGSLALAVGLSAPLWLPFVAESRWVGIALGPSDGYKRHLAPWDLFVQFQPLYRYRVQHGGAADHPLSWLTAALFAVVVGLLIWRLMRRGRVAALPALGFGLALTAVSAFMATQPSLFVWEPLAPILANLQYPWRFLTLTGLGFAMCVGALPALLWCRRPLTADDRPQRRLHGLRARSGDRPEPEGSSARLARYGRSPTEPPPGSGDRPEPEGSSARLARYGRSPTEPPPGSGDQPEPEGPARVSASSASLWCRSASSVGVCVLLSTVVLVLILQPLITAPARPLPITAAEAWAPDRMWREDAEMGQVGATWTGEFLPLTVTEQRWALGRAREGATDSPAFTPRPAVRIERLGYDAAELTVDAAAPLTVRLHQFYLPAWHVTLNGDTLITYPAGELGLVAVDLPAGGGRLAVRFGPTPAWLLAAALAMLAATVWAVWAWHERRADRRLVLTAVAMLLIVALLGLNQVGVGQRMWTPQPVNAAVGDVALLLGYDTAPARGADALDVTLYWFALRDVAANYKVFVHLLGKDGAVIAQHDGDPVGGYTPTSRWRSGELIADRHRIPLPSGLASGEYGLKAGMYQPEPLHNLPVEPPSADGRVDLGQVNLAETQSNVQ